MRKIFVLSFVSLDGIMQAPGGSEEDTSGGFRYGGWTFPYFDEFSGKEMIDQLSIGCDLLLGRKTYEIFAAYWPLADIEKDPIAAAFSKASKYVVSESLKEASWAGSFIIRSADEIRKLKETAGPDLQVHGSGNLIQTLLKNNLVDELWLKTFPVVLGSGKRLFDDKEFARSFEIIESKISPSGVILTKYKIDGEVKTGSFA